MRKFSVKTSEVGTRADVFVAGQYPEFTRASLERLFTDNLVSINAKPAKPGQKLHLDDAVKVDDTLLRQKPADVELSVIYEDKNVIVIDKPAGILTHSKGALNIEATVASFIAPKLTDKNLSGNRAGVVHRLDRDTSGVIITAKTDEVQKYLQKQFSTRKVKKTYIAIVEGQPDPAEAVIDTPIGRNPKAPQTFRVSTDGKEAQTHYKTLKTFSKSGKTYSLLELKPKTGRTHQLRVHLQYIKHPIVGDRVYGHEGPRLYLHAKSLEITMPDRERKVLEASLPKVFTDFSQS